MINLFGSKIGNSITIACSGGLDSMCAAHFLAQKKYREVHLLFVHHGTVTSQQAEGFLRTHGANAIGAKSLTVRHIKSTKPPKVSPEEHWRNERYRIFHEWHDKTGIEIVAAHHLDDCIETYLFNAMNGKLASIAYRHGPVIRPFLLTKKASMKSWCVKHNVPWIEDQSNNDRKYTRNKIRHDLIPHALRVNPGLHKIAAKYAGLDFKEKKWLPFQEEE